MHENIDVVLYRDWPDEKLHAYIDIKSRNRFD